jgi:Ca2+-binding RTX toxin-like protein
VKVADNPNDRCGGRSSDPGTLDPFGECQTRKGLAAYSFNGALEPDWDPALEGNYLLAWALHADGTRLHVGGEFTTVSGLKQTNYARLSTPPDTTPPTIRGEAPVNSQTDVALEANVEATFSEGIDPSSLNSATFTLSQSYGTPVAATLSYDPSTKKAILNPDAPLDSKATYTAIVRGGTVGVKDPSGNPLAEDRVWSFTTTLACTISGTPSAETLTGTAADDVICAGGGNDTINALEGNDTLKGEGGTDQLRSGLGDDALEGGLGTDTANFSGSVASINASLTDGTASGEGSDAFSGIETIIGSEQADRLTGSAANDTLNGAGGADSIVGLGGADALKGAGGGDMLDSRDGLEGNDALDGGTGTDTCLTDATELSIVGCER